MKDEKKKRIILVVGMIMLTALIIWLKLFHLDLSFSLRKQAVEDVNFIPFIALFRRPQHYVWLKYVINVLVYIPFGVCASVLLKKWYKVLGLCVIISVLMEMIQFLFSLGVADITSVILNAFGGLIGFILGKRFEKCNDFAAAIITIVISMGAALLYVIIVLVSGYL